MRNKRKIRVMEDIKRRIDYMKEESEDLNESEAQMKVIATIKTEKQKNDFAYVANVTGITNE